MKVLIIEDDLLTRKVLKFRLEAQGIDVIELEDGLNSDEYAQFKEIDFYIVDLHLPTIHGSKVVDHVLDHNPEANIILTSGDEQSTLKKTLLTKAKAFLQKPYTKNEFLELDKVIGYE